MASVLIQTFFSRRRYNPKDLNSMTHITVFKYSVLQVLTKFCTNQRRTHPSLGLPSNSLETSPPKKQNGEKDRKTNDPFCRLEYVCSCCTSGISCVS